MKNLLTLSLVFFMMPNYIFAQDDESADVEEVIVTATKRETNLMETPLAVSVITQEQMALQGLQEYLIYLHWFQTLLLEIQGKTQVFQLQ